MNDEISVYEILREIRELLDALREKRGKVAANREKSLEKVGGAEK